MGRRASFHAWGKCAQIFGLAAGLVGWFSPAALAGSDISPPAALDSAGPKQPFTAYNGSYSYSVPIEVPAFRGLEPKLALAYDSSRTLRNSAGTGNWLGAGWTLDGLSVIERISGTPIPVAGQEKAPSGRGSPRFASAGLPPDSFMLDGVELMPCTQLVATASVPSCQPSTAGGPIPANGYASRVENFMRIRRLLDDSGWEVTARDGTKYLYEDLEAGTASPGFRWHLTKVTDLNSNYVDYGYYCPAEGSQYEVECLLTTIRYYNSGQASAVSTIAFYYDSRPDVQTYATGQADLQKQDRLLKTIRILNGSQTVRAYKLTYTLGNATGLSRLAAVQQYAGDFYDAPGGDPDAYDVKLDASFTITGGHALPPATFTYSDIALNALWANTAWTPGTGGFKRDALTGDFNGDGRTDYCTLTRFDDLPAIGAQPHRIVTTPGKTLLSTGSGFTDVDVPCGLSTFVEEHVPSEQINEQHRETYLGDFDGDGADDVLNWSWSKTEYCTGGTGGSGNQTCEVRSSGVAFSFKRFNGTAFVTIPTLSFNAQADDDFERQRHRVSAAGDFNGDGRADLVTGKGDVYRSTSDGFVLENWGAPAGFETTAADVNGDGKTDLFRLANISGDWYGRVFISTGSAFVAQDLFPITPTQDDTRWDVVLGDVNGDGRSDLVRVYKYGNDLGTPQEVYGVTIYPSMGLTFKPGTEVLYGGFDAAYGDSAKLADINGDGRTDLLLANANMESDGKDYYAYKAFRSTGDGFALTGSAVTFYQTAGDFDGDGRSDFLLSGTMLQSAGDLPPDLLTSITEPLGGKISVAYESSAGKPGTALPFVMHVVSSVTYDDGRRDGTTPIWTATTDFDYENGTWSAAERQFEGFQKVTAFLPKIEGETQRPKVISTYQQNLACLGKPTVTQTFKVTGTAGNPVDTSVRMVSDSLVIDSQAPFICNNTRTETRDTGPATENPATQSRSRFMGTTRLFDAYGNVLRTVHHGVLNGVSDYTPNGDELLERSVFFYNLDRFITSCPALTDRYAGTTGNDPRLTLTYRYYDDATLYNTPPASCEETKTSSEVEAGQLVTARTEYDAYGNKTAESDAAGNRTEYIYDDWTKLFVKETRLPLYTPSTPKFKTTATSYSPCRLTASETDVNGGVTARFYDEFCRLTEETRPGGDYTRYFYQYLPYYTDASGAVSGTPTAHPNYQYIQITRRGPISSPWSQQSLDGFGRAWKEERYALDGAAATRIRVARSFNARGAVRTQSAPYFITQAQYDETYDYDTLGRLIKQTHADSPASAIALTHSLPAGAGEFSAVTAADETGRKTRYHFDAAGKLVKRVKLGTEASPVQYNTSYIRDRMGRLTAITDPGGAAWAYEYDGLSRRTRAADPDLGTWTYVYDAAGRLIRQTDAKGQVTALSYDKMDRVLSKSVTAQPSGIVETTTNSYDETGGAWHAGYPNVGYLTQAIKTRSGSSEAIANVTYDYDVAGRLARQMLFRVMDDATRRTIASDYYPSGELRSRTWPSGTGSGAGTYTALYGYNAAGQLATVDKELDTGGVQPLITAITYDARGRAVRTGYGNQVATVNSYDAARGFLNTAVSRKLSGAAMLDLSYTRDKAGRITRVENAAQASNEENWDYSYDELGQLTGADNLGSNGKDQSFRYNGNGTMACNSGLDTGIAWADRLAWCGNAGNTNLSYGGYPKHAPSSITGGFPGTFSYDANGNMLTSTVLGVERSFAYDGENRPLSIAVADAATYYFEYGPDGERIRKQTNAGNYERTVYFGNDAELSTAPGQPDGEWTLYPHGDVRKSGTAGDAVTYLHKDHLGSNRAISGSPCVSKGQASGNWRVLCLFDGDCEAAVINSIPLHWNAGACLGFLRISGFCFRTGRWRSGSMRRRRRGSRPSNFIGRMKFRQRA